MRWLVLLIVVAVPTIVVAKPKVAVAPLDGDSDGKIADIVVNAADDHAKVVRPEKVSKAMETLSVTTFNGKGLKKLRTNLEVDLVIFGSVEKTGAKHKLELTIAGKGKKKETVTITYKSTKTLKKDLSTQLRQKVSNLLGGDEDPDDEDAPPKKEEPRKHDDDDHPKKHADDDRPKKHDDDDRPKKHDDDRPKRHVADDDTSTRKRHNTEDEDETRHRHRKHKEGRNPLTQAALWLDVGAEVARRTLTWKGGGTTMPPRVGTAAAAGRVNGEVYPAGFDKVDGAGALGLYGEFGYTLGLSIKVPGTSSSTPIKDGHYAIGARYRVAFGSSSVAFGASYWRRYYIADRSALMAGQTLDMPDVDYTAVTPNLLARFAATPTIAAFTSLDVPLIFSSGDIQSATSYGRGKVIAFDVRAGLQFTLAAHYAVAIAAEFDQIGISFEAGQNSKAMTRGVSGATDRTIALTATLGIDY